MSIYVIADLHLSFSQNKPMNIFGANWNNHDEKIKNNWINNVKENDYVIVSGDFSWATYLEDTKKDFEYINKLPGNKILLKGNHDYWWNTLRSMRLFLKENNFGKIDFLYNNSYQIEDKIIVGTRGWNIQDNDEDRKMINRENERLKLSINHAIDTYGKGNEIVAFFHYPPINQNVLYHNETTPFVETLKEYGIKKCYYGHLHGNSHNDAIEAEIDGINYMLISADYLNFNLLKI